MTIAHLVLAVFAVACFGIDAWVNPAPTKLTSLGLALLSASFISW